MRNPRFSMLLAAAAAALCAAPAPAQKNTIDVKYQSIPRDFQELLKTDAGSWNSNFRLYDKLAAEQLWTDPNVIRDALDGLDTPGEAPTAIHVSCDEFGISLLVFAGDPDFQATTREGKVPRCTIELFLEPGTSETARIVPYYQMVINMLNPREECDVFDWLMEDREYRSLREHIAIDTRFLANGALMRLFVPWVPLFDRLPLDGQKNNIWRLSVIRWGAKGGGQTWGGEVHAHSGAGYIRFPDFTPAQKTAIRKHVLQTAWHEFHAFLKLPDYNPALVKPPANPLAEKVVHRSFMNYNEDFGFREFWLEQAIAERTALGRGTADLGAMSPEAQAAFYAEAADKLFNFRYDLEEAYGAYMNAKLLQR